ncbi:MAG: histidinol-phosphate transaminase [Rhodospirillales bacterium]|nr:histidinol-phosphate transaminase [Rhodospirillales bacterium]
MQFQSARQTEVSKPVPRPEIFSVAAYVGGESKLAGFETPTKLSSNEGAFGPPPGALQAIAGAGAAMHRYPDGGALKLRQAIGAKFGLDPERIVCGNGSDEILTLLIQSYGGPGTELIMSEHGFSIYEISGRLAGCTVLKAPEKDLTTDVDAILALVSPATRMVFIANPNNPTGTMLGQGEMERLRNLLPAHVLLVLDAAYSEYVERADYDAGVKLVDAGENTVMTRTFSKIFGMGGARLGWGYAPPAIVDVLNRVRPPFPVNNFAAAAGIAALAESGWLEMSRAHNSAERRRLAERLTQAGLRVTPSEANFILVDFVTTARAGAADAHLRRHGIIVRQVKSYGLPHCLRITIGTSEECSRVAELLTEFCHG